MNITLCTDVAIISIAAVYVIDRGAGLVETLVRDARDRRDRQASSSPAADVGESPSPVAAPTTSTELPAARRDRVTGMAVRADGGNRVLDKLRAEANGSHA